jgi:hypothetical protein
MSLAVMMMLLMTFEDQGLRSEVTSFMVPDELMTVALFVDYICREHILDQRL